MSISRIYGDVVFTCDNCDDTLETHEDDFTTALAVSRSEGWRADKVGSEWEHRCPQCRGDGGYRSRAEDFR